MAVSFDLGEVIATRTLVDADGSEVLVEIGKPFREHDVFNGIFVCPYRVQDRLDSYAGGDDAVEALMIAMRKIGLELGIHHPTLTFGPPRSSNGFPRSEWNFGT